MKRIITALLIITMMFTMSGCDRCTEEDAANMVQGLLDATYKGDFEMFNKYANMQTMTAEEFYNQELDKRIETATSGSDMSDNQRESIREAIIEMRALAKYEVQGAEKTGKDKFVVTVKVYPSNVMQVYLQKALDSAMRTMDMDNIDRIAINANTMRKAIKENSYSDPVTIKVTLYKKDGGYEISDKDLEKVSDALFE